MKVKHLIKMLKREKYDYEQRKDLMEKGGDFEDLNISIDIDVGSRQGPNGIYNIESGYLDTAEVSTDADGKVSFFVLGKEGEEPEDNVSNSFHDRDEEYEDVVL